VGERPGHCRSTALPRTGRLLWCFGRVQNCFHVIITDGCTVKFLETCGAAFTHSQSGEIGPGFEQLLDQLAEEGVDEAAKRYLIPNRIVAKGASAAPDAAAAGGW
jgi:hypothetical protein